MCRQDRAQLPCLGATRSQVGSTVHIRALLGAGTDRMLGSSLSVWGPALGQVHMQVPYGSMHYPEGWRREAMNPGQEQHPSL